MNIEDLTGEILEVIIEETGLKIGGLVYCEYHHREEGYVCVTNIYNCPMTHPYSNWYNEAYFKKIIVS